METVETVLLGVMAVTAIGFCVTVILIVGDEISLRRKMKRWRS
jgi:hypothetical protein